MSGKRRLLPEHIQAHLFVNMSVSVVGEHIHVLGELVEDELLWHADSGPWTDCCWVLGVEGGKFGGAAIDVRSHLHILSWLEGVSQVSVSLLSGPPRDRC